ncbi:MAG: hypothetical protein PF436_00200 [Prolixibacteraceae bacterium]|jgi:hypothetical protein|nr:hypothetical protein [Prolixibacteraceae bacterium]
MKPITYQVSIRVFINEMMTFYKDDPRLGTRENPYKADMFYEVLSPYAHFYGPLRNILIFEKNSVYIWTLETDTGRKLRFSSNDDVSEMDLEMITDSPSEKKWKKVFINPPKMQSGGKIKLKSKSKSSNEFSLETTGDIKSGGRIKYSFLFEFEDEDGNTKYGIVDPNGDTYPPPPPPYIPLLVEP